MTDVIPFGDRPKIRDGLVGYLRYLKSKGAPVERSLWLERVNAEMERQHLPVFAPKKREADDGVPPPPPAEGDGLPVPHEPMPGP